MAGSGINISYQKTKKKKKKPKPPPSPLICFLIWNNHPGQKLVQICLGLTTEFLKAPHFVFLICMHLTSEGLNMSTAMLMWLFFIATFQSITVFWSGLYWRSVKYREQNKAVVSANPPSRHFLNILPMFCILCQCSARSFHFLLFFFIFSQEKINQDLKSENMQSASESFSSEACYVLLLELLGLTACEL